MNPADTRICKLIEDLLDGRIGAAEFWARSRGACDGASPGAMTAWHLASHFVTDKDIRQRDPEYGRVEADKLRSLIERLKEPEKVPE